MHGGIFKSNFTAGKRRSKAKALGAKSDVGNALLGMMPFVITAGAVRLVGKGHSSPNHYEKKALVMPPIASTANG